MLVCIDKVTCARMFQRIIPRWQAKLTNGQVLCASKASLGRASDAKVGDRLAKALESLRGPGRVDGRDDHRDHHQRSPERGARLQEMGLRHHPAPARDEDRLRDAGRRARGRGDAFKDPEHPFRVAIVCAMWLTGFDVECLSTLYIDKPMKAHTLMQAIARANRVYPGKDCGRHRRLQRHAQEPS